VPQNHTPKREAAEFSVDKIAAQLRFFATEIDKVNARVVDFALRDIIKNLPERRHLDAVDYFAGMPSIAQEAGTASNGAIQIKFKVCPIRKALEKGG
jgi:hypothetical protein